MTMKKSAYKPAILAEARKCFCKYGVRAVRMDDIAKNLNISKRTIYEIYNTKEEVLLDVLEGILKDRLDYMTEYAESHESAFDVMLEALRMQLDFSVTTNVLFFNDLKRYPTVGESFMKNLKKQTNKSHEFFKKGVEQGYFLAYIDYSVFHSIVSGTMEMMQRSKEFQKLTYKELFVNFLSVVTRGICTPKGQQQLEAFLVKYI